MLVIGLLIAFCLYVGLYWLYLAAESHASSASSALATLNHILLMPDNNIFFLLRGLILVTFFYVAADFLISPARDELKNRRRRRHEAERDARAFKGAHAPREVQNDDEDFLANAH